MKEPRRLDYEKYDVSQARRRFRDDFWPVYSVVSFLTFAVLFYVATATRAHLPDCFFVLLGVVGYGLHTAIVWIGCMAFEAHRQIPQPLWRITGFVVGFLLVLSELGLVVLAEWIFSVF